MPPVVLLKLPVDTAVLYPTQERISPSCPFEQIAPQKMLQAAAQVSTALLTEHRRFQALWYSMSLIEWHWQEHQERLRKLGAPLTPEAYRRLQDESQLSMDIWEVIQADCPIYREQRLWPAQSGAAEVARARLLARLRPGLRNPQADMALRQRAAQCQTSRQALLRSTIFPDAIFLVSQDAATPQRMRVREHWAVNEHGKVQPASPAESLPGHTFTHWWFSQVYVAAAALLLGEVYPRPTTQTVSMVLCEEDALERLAAPESPGARDSAMLTALLAGEETDPADQLHRLLTVASPRACELFRLVSQGLSIKEAASRIGMARNTAYTHYRRTRQKITR